ncbi:DNA topoisomerase III [Trichonephila clavipes]|nr:DNA topoisomerase III [Trichonephila clavipes]
MIATLLILQGFVDPGDKVFQKFMLDNVKITKERDEELYAIDGFYHQSSDFGTCGKITILKKVIVVCCRLVVSNAKPWELIVRRWRANKAHSKSYYYMLDGSFTFGAGSLTARLQFPEDAPVDEKGHVLQKSYVDELAAAVNGKAARVVDASVKDKENRAKAAV